MIDIKKLKRMSSMSKRMVVIKNIGENKNTDVEYVFGLLNLYNKKNSGRWFWQKAVFTGILKDAFDKFNTTVDEIIKSLKSENEESVLKRISAATDTLEDLLTKLEMNLGVDRENDKTYVKGHLDDNFKSLIAGSLKEIEK
jgi:hypothetical protein